MILKTKNSYQVTCKEGVAPTAALKARRQQAMLSKFCGKNDSLSRTPHLIKQALDISDMQSLKKFAFHALSEVSKNVSHQKEGRKQKMRRHAIQKQVMQDKKGARESSGSHAPAPPEQEGRKPPRTHWGIWRAGRVERELVLRS